MSEERSDFIGEESQSRCADLRDSFLHQNRHRPYSTVQAGSFEAGDVQWFPEGGLNVSYNCVDRWAYKTPNKVGFRAWL